MYAYLANTFDFQLERENPVQTVFSWLKQELEAHRARATQKRLIADLRTLDRDILEDIGVNFASLGETQPTLLSFNPHLLAVNIFSGRSLQLTQRRSR